MGLRGLEWWVPSCNHVWSVAAFQIPLVVPGDEVLR